MFHKNYTPCATLLPSHHYKVASRIPPPERDGLSALLGGIFTTHFSQLGNLGSPNCQQWHLILIILVAANAAVETTLGKSDLEATSMVKGETKGRMKQSLAAEIENIIFLVYPSNFEKAILTHNVSHRDICSSHLRPAFLLSMMEVDAHNSVSNMKFHQMIPDAKLSSYSKLKPTSTLYITPIIQLTLVSLRTS